MAKQIQKLVSNPDEEKRVIDGVYNTSKMLLTIDDSKVVKCFKVESNSSERRYLREKKALEMLVHVPNTPRLIHYEDSQNKIEMTRLPGQSVDALSVSHLWQLTTIVNNMLRHGIARHSLPIRDIVVDVSNQVGLVDFERVTFRHWRLSPIWLIAKQVSRYHLYRLISQYQPQILTPYQTWLVNFGARLKGVVAFIHSLSD